MPRFLRILAGLAVLAAAAAAPAAVIHVPGDFAQIHAAVQAAAAGDVVEVAAGTYGDCTHPTEGPGSTPACVIMKSGVTLRGAGTAATIIDAQLLGRGIFVENVVNCRIENLQVRRAYAAAYGAGILLRQVGPDVRVTDVLVTECTDGGVICYNQASPVLTRVDCVANTAKQGGGLAIEEQSSPRVDDCDILDNHAPSGAGVFIRNGSDPHLTDCTVSGNAINAAYGQGAGIFVAASSPLIERCTISGNTTLGNGGGIAYQLGSAGVLRACAITGNVAAQSFVSGAGVAVDSAEPLIEGCLIAGNVCSGSFSDAAGVHALFSPSPTLRNCTIAGNQTSAGGLAGGVMAQWGSAPTIDRCIIAASPVGAGLYCDGGNPTVSCTDIHGNAGGNALCGVDGGGNFSLDPLFCAPGDYHLQPGSPCLTGCGGELVGAPLGRCGATAVGETTARSRLLGNHPNPFNPSTTIVFALDAPGAALVRITDVSGRTVATLTLGDLPAGRHEAVWDGRDDAGRPAPSGVYMYELQALGLQHTRRMILIK
ncbi:MAG: right-handed parallel beta-helix repeat-containing protein [bacterium]|nr:right-handed parallel beta-helix repeat-containing protein [bacterium]